MSKTVIMCECTYCGYKWQPYTNQYGWVLEKDDKCSKCGDKNVRKRQFNKVDYYSDQPAIELDTEGAD